MVIKLFNCFVVFYNTVLTNVHRNPIAENNVLETTPVGKDAKITAFHAPNLKLVSWLQVN